MKRREFIRNLALSALAARVLPARADYTGNEARKLYVFDGAGFPTTLESKHTVELTENIVGSLRSAGYRMIQTTVGTVGPGEGLFDKTMEDIHRVRSSVEEFPEQMMLVTSRKQLEEAERSGRTGLIMGFQDSRQLEGQLENVDRFYEAGVRCMQLTYNLDNSAGSGCLSAEDRGLTRFGREVIECLREKGIVLDLSHASRRSVNQALDQVNHPLAITHSGCASVFDHPRNNTDDSLRRLADKGGVIGIYFMPYLCAEGTANSSDLIAHIDHAINICGEDAVGIGTDNSTMPVELTDEYRTEFANQIAVRKKAGISAPREDENSFLFIDDLNTEDRFFKLAALLQKHGYSEARIEKIMGRNFRRLFAEVL